MLVLDYFEFSQNDHKILLTDNSLYKKKTFALFLQNGSPLDIGSTFNQPRCA